MNKFESELKDTLIFAARHGYASDAAEKVSETDGSTSIRLQRDDWAVHDNYFTSEDGLRYHGRLVAFLGDKAMWFCGYSGFVEESAEPSDVYGFLKQAMLRPEVEFPVRGPWQYADSGFDYIFTKSYSNASLQRFEAIETIARDDQSIYEATFYGGNIA